MSEQVAMCACRHVEYRNDESHGRVTREWWQCRDCGTIFHKEHEIARLKAELATLEDTRLLDELNELINYDDTEGGLLYHIEGWLRGSRDIRFAVRAAIESKEGR